MCYRAFKPSPNQSCTNLLVVDSLHGKVVWITGASSGIGEYLAYQLARIGCRLVLSARRENELERVKEQCLCKSLVQTILVNCISSVQRILCN